MFRRVLIGLCVIVALVNARVAPTPSRAAVPCAFLSAPTAAAFCDTFDAPAGTGNRAGDLNGLVWGASRTSQDSTGSQSDYFASAATPACGGGTVAPESDIFICGGTLFDVMNDHGGWADVSMYPKQPFDFAGRVGTVTFDVSNNTQGIHAAWPNFWITDQPVPAPVQHTQYNPTTTQMAAPRNGLGFSLAQLCAAGTYCGPACPYPSPNGFTVDSMFLSANYAMRDVGFTKDGCVQKATNLTALNHIEVQVSATSMVVYATDPGSTRLVKIAHSSAFTAPLSRGLIWIQDFHYNGNKFNSQGTNTFAWDNVAFDGPVVAQDRTFDVLDCLCSGNLGWRPGTVGIPLPTLPLPASDLAAASAALLTFNFYPTVAGPLTYRLNSGATHTLAWPFSDTGTYLWRTLAVPLVLGEVQAGVNTVTIGLPGSGSVLANIDIVLPGVGGSGGAPTSTPLPMATDTPLAAATDTPLPATSTPVPATSTPVPATSTPLGDAPTATPTSTDTPPTPHPAICATMPLTTTALHRR